MLSLPIIVLLGGPMSQNLTPRPVCQSPPLAACVLGMCGISVLLWYRRCRGSRFYVVGEWPAWCMSVGDRDLGTPVAQIGKRLGAFWQRPALGGLIGTVLWRCGLPASWRW